MEEAVEVLSPFFHATDAMQSDKETASLPLPLIVMISESLKSNRHMRNGTFVRNDDLSPATLVFRRQLLVELKERFKFLKEGLTNVDKAKVANQFLVPAYLTPKYMNLQQCMGIRPHMVQRTESLIKEEMKMALKPLYDHLVRQHREWVARENYRVLEEQRKRARGVARGDDGGSQQKKRKVGTGSAASAMMDLLLFNATVEDEASHDGGEEGEEKEDEKAVTTPAEVIDAIIDDEVTLYAVKATEARQADAEQGVRMDSRREALRIY